MAVDVSPEILEEIEKNFEEYYKDPKSKRIYNKIVDCTATYKDIQDLAEIVASHILKSVEEAYTGALESGELPNDTLYENIVDKTLSPTLRDGHGIVTEACGYVQKDLNRKTGIGLGVVEPTINEDKVLGLVHEVANKNNVRLSQTIFDGLIDTFTRSIVDDSVQFNLDFQEESGLKPQISRTRGANSNKDCPYCPGLVYTGDYNGPGMPAEIFRRHRYCHCNVIYIGVDGKAQDVWAKKEYEDYREAERKQRKYLRDLDKMTPAERRAVRNAKRREQRRIKRSPKGQQEKNVWSARHTPNKQTAIKRYEQGFQKANTIDEAKEFAKNKLGLETASFNDMNLEVANRFNFEIQKAYDAFGNLNNKGVLSGLRILKGNDTPVAAYNHAMREVFLYKKNVGFKSSIRKLREQAVFQKSEGFWSTASEMHSIRHELGHSVRFTLTDIQYEKINAIRESILTKTGVTKWSMADTIEHRRAAGNYLSYYALKNTDEFIAEAIAEFMDGSPRKTASDVIKIIRGK